MDVDGVVWLSGELDLATADSFSQAVASMLDGQQPVLDFSDLTFVDSSGIRAILALSHAKGQVVLRNLPENVRKVLVIAGVDETMGVRIEPAG
jgi:anti-anti-sigma factor